jgi:phage terminase small subunit
MQDEPKTNRYIKIKTRPGKIKSPIQTALDTEDLQTVLDAITDKQKTFIENYLGPAHLNATEAVRMSGYQTKNPNRIASVLLKNPAVRFCIDGLKAQRTKNSDVTSDYVLKEIVEAIDSSKLAGNHNATLRGLELLARHLGMFVERTEISGRDGEAIKIEKTKEDADDLTSAIARLAKRGREGSVARLIDTGTEG